MYVCICEQKILTNLLTSKANKSSSQQVNKSTSL